MAQVAPCHSKRYPGVDHICTSCTEGNNIEATNRQPGTGGGKLWNRCAELRREGRC